MIIMTYMVQCPYCFEFYDADEYELCPNCGNWNHINVYYVDRKTPTADTNTTKDNKNKTLE
jgi:rRNA maturation endonuclease Nob1